MNTEKCIVVNSSTYAEKAKKILTERGINSKIKRIKGNEHGCGRCISVNSENVDTVVNILRKNGVIMTGEIKDEKNIS